MEGEFFVVFYDVVYYVSIVIWVSIYGKYLLIIIRNISDLKKIRNDNKKYRFLKMYEENFLFVLCNWKIWGLKKIFVFIVLFG